MSKKLNIMSFAVDPDMQDLIKKCSLEDGISSSKLLRNLVDRYLLNKDKTIIIEYDEETIPVVLRIPVKLRGDSRLKDWLKAKSEAIANKLAPE